MTKKLILLRSITYAYKAKDYLAKEGIRVTVLRTPSSLSPCGCGFSIGTREDPGRVCRLLERYGIRVVGVAKENGEGEWITEEPNDLL